MMQTKRCNRLDDFLMKKMLNSEKNYFSDEERYQAYRIFLRLTTKEGKRIAATQTIKVFTVFFPNIIRTIMLSDGKIAWQRLFKTIYHLYAIIICHLVIESIQKNHLTIIPFS